MWQGWEWLPMECKQANTCATPATKLCSLCLKFTKIHFITISPIATLLNPHSINIKINKFLFTSKGDFYVKKIIESVNVQQTASILKISCIFFSSKGIKNLKLLQKIHKYFILFYSARPWNPIYVWAYIYVHKLSHIHMHICIFYKPAIARGKFETHSESIKVAFKKFRRKCILLVCIYMYKLHTYM